ncbi:MAG: hypothetical protein IVW36_12320 [Dehalococcoidia bacterium]|nr:hypothetical protein [Dehalococcoidia bacterium]
MNMRPSGWGTLLGTAVALALLIVAAATLRSAEGSTYKVLVAVWLWALPVIGAFATMGYLLGKGAESLHCGEEQPR